MQVHERVGMLLLLSREFVLYGKTFDLRPLVYKIMTSNKLNSKNKQKEPDLFTNQQWYYRKLILKLHYPTKTLKT